MAGIRLRDATTEDDLVVLDRLWQLYLFEFQLIANQYPIGPDGLFSAAEELRSSAALAHKTATLIDATYSESSSELAGFALVSHDPNDVYEIEQFFILPRCRRLGIGMRAAHTLFARHPGPWTVFEMEENARAILFWRHVIALTVGPAGYEEERGTKDGLPGRWQSFFVMR